MEKHSNIIVSIIIIVIFSACQNHHNNKTENYETPILNGLRPAVLVNDDEITYNLQERMEYWNVPAVSFVVIDNMQIVYTGAFGVKQMGDTTSIDTNTLFQAASVSKPVAAIGAMSLAYKKQLDIDKEINQLASGWQFSYGEYQEPITIRKILSHSAGLNVGGFSGYQSEDSLPSLLDIIEGKFPANSPAVRIIEKPGTKFMYSGGGYQIMQKIMEDVTNESFSDIMKNNVFEPLNMSHSYYAPLDSVQKNNAAHGHLPNIIPNYGPIHVESAAGGLWTTPTDLGYLLIDLMKAYTNKESKILDSETLHSIMTPVFWNYGFGFKIMGEDQDFRFSHGGATAGWHSHFMAFPEKGQAVVVMTNGTNGWMLWPEIERSVANIFKWPILQPKSISPKKITEEETESYTGSYKMGGFQVQIKEDTMGLNFEGAGLKWNLVPTNKDTLEIIDIEGQVFFKRDSENVVNGFHMWFGQPDWSPYREWDFTKQMNK
jgi:CubicO group peptidase (beta-lactamase class C family)